ncbi:MAG TPA: hypothetical protein VGV69_02310 [Solirubrobacterales bacterium]|nr:hypothetical protein [Solirubrobacterales bacterium]
MSYQPDPGGIFASDVHRRTAGHLPQPEEEPISTAALLARLDPDASTPVGDELTLTQVLESLAKAGQIEGADGLWRQTTKGHSDLCGPIADEPPPLSGEALAKAEAAEAELVQAEEEMAQEAKAARVERLKSELKEAEEDV